MLLCDAQMLCEYLSDTLTDTKTHNAARLLKKRQPAAAVAAGILHQQQINIVKSVSRRM